MTRKRLVVAVVAAGAVAGGMFRPELWPTASLSRRGW
jgi:hypothetical protein